MGSVRRIQVLVIRTIQKERCSFINCPPGDLAAITYGNVFSIFGNYFHVFPINLEDFIELEVTLERNHQNSQVVLFYSQMLLYCVIYSKFVTMYRHFLNK
jgi:hypothetical protein